MQNEHFSSPAMGRARRLAAAVTIALITGCSSAATATPTPSTALLPSASASTPPTRSPRAAPTAALTGSTTAATSAPPGAIELRTDGNKFDYAPRALWAKPGTVSFYITNVPPKGGSSDRRHNMAIGRTIGQPLIRSNGIDQGDAVIFTVQDLEPGTYFFYCTIAENAGLQHYQMGMVGALTVGVGAN